LKDGDNLWRGVREGEPQVAAFLATNKDRLRAQNGSQPIVKTSTAMKLLRQTSYSESRFLGGFAAAAAASGRLSGSFADEFSGPDGGDEFLYAVIVEIDRRAIGV
jgi:hypothetical protein